jgi:hypothetical protein
VGPVDNQVVIATDEAAFAGNFAQILVSPTINGSL